VVEVVDQKMFQNYT